VLVLQSALRLAVLQSLMQPSGDAQADSSTSQQQSMATAGLADTLRALNNGTAVEPSRLEDLERYLSAFDGKASSALLFRGTRSLHALCEFFLTAKSAYHLSMQLLASTPFLHSAPQIPHVHYRPVVHRGGATSSGDAPQEAISIDGSDKCGGPLLPTAIQKLCALMRESQGGHFELSTNYGDLGRGGTWLNIRAPAPTPPLPQPLAKLHVQHQREVSPEIEDTEGGRDVPRTVDRAICQGGQLYILPR